MSKTNWLNFKITIGHTAAGKPVQCSIATLIKTRLLITANSGGGKSWLLRLIAELLAPHMPVHIIDPEGDFASLREKFNFVLIGKGGETAADSRSIQMVTHRLLELRASAVFDLYEMPIHERHRIVRLYSEAMINAPKHLWKPTAVILDEAHIFCPEKGYGESEAKDAVLGFATRGRKRGFLSIYATQRLSNFSKDASSQLLNRLVGGTFEDVDLKRVIDLLSVEQENKKAFRKEMQMMDPGWFYGLGRAISKERVLFHADKVQTTHETEQKYSQAPPPPPDAIKAMLPQLEDLPKEAEEKEQTEKELKQKIRELEKSLREAETRQPVAPVVKMCKPPKPPKRVEVSIIDNKTVRAVDSLDTTLIRANAILEGVTKTFVAAREQGQAIMEAVQKQIADARTRDAAQARSIPTMNPLEPGIIPPRARHTPPPPPAGWPEIGEAEIEQARGDLEKNGETKLGQAARNCLGVLNQFRAGCTMSKIALLAGYRVTGGLRNALAELRGSSFMVGENTGVMVITPLGVAYAEKNKIVSDVPDDLEGRYKFWLNHNSFGECSRKIIEVLWKENREMGMAELAEKTGYKITGGFRNATGDLRTAGVIVGKNTEPMKLNPLMFA